MRGRRGWQVTGTLSLAFVLVFGAVQTWAMVVQQKTVSERTYQVPVTRVELDTGTAAVVIRPGAPGRVHVKQYLDWTVRKPTVSAVFEGDALTVRMRCNQVLPAVDVGCAALIELEVPVATSVSGGGTSGSIEVQDLTGSIRLAATSGAIQLVGLSGEVSARTTSGLLRASGLTSARVEARSFSGEVDLGFVRAPHLVDVGVSSGAVSLGLPPGSRYAFDFSGGAVGGERHVDPELADASSPDTVRVGTTSGSVRVVSGAADRGPS
ncbi:DUF4097 family beta strand repeat-containing protein [Kitasatospora sp. NPDC091207]|uniref:DUF4097 family beta strand repeat-containing protein n=1 Tax=Kitasatospora sp. NPDC091207 TaxID=3364083 RepID=UPI00381363A3